MIVKNRTNSPYQLIDKDGNKVMLPAQGSVEIEPHPMYVNQYKQVGYFDISEPENEPLDALRAEYRELSGEDADNRWREGRLQSEIEALKGQGDE